MLKPNHILEKGIDKIIRYKIRKDVYTPWYLCSHPIFSGVSENIETIQGGL